jgi:uncharacterized membrane protein YtjA (UPF0391 family)
MPISRHGGTTFAITRSGGEEMLRLALTFFLIGIIAALLGFTGIAGASFAIAKVFALIFGVLFLLFLVLGLSAANRLTT